MTEKRFGKVYQSLRQKLTRLRVTPTSGKLATFLLKKFVEQQGGIKADECYILELVPAGMTFAEWSKEMQNKCVWKIHYKKGTHIITHYSPLSAIMPYINSAKRQRSELLTADSYDTQLMEKRMSFMERKFQVLSERGSWNESLHLSLFPEDVDFLEVPF